MPPLWSSGEDFYPQWSGESGEDSLEDESDVQPASLAEMAFWYMIVLLAMLLIWLLMFFCLRIIALRQKTRSAPPRRAYGGSRPRTSLAPSEPTVYVSPSNLPPPPKYEFMAPPSYEEVVGTHYPNYPVQPIAQPITNALAQSSSNTAANSGDVTITVVNSGNYAPANITVSTEPEEARRTSATAIRT